MTDPDRKKGAWMPRWVVLTIVGLFSLALSIVFNDVTWTSAGEIPHWLPQTIVYLFAGSGFLFLLVAYLSRNQKPLDED